MTDHRMLANQLLADGFNDAAGVHALLAIAEILDTLPARMLGQMDPTPVTATDLTVFDEIRMERAAQVAQSWTFEHDQQHGIDHLYRLINSYLFKPGDHPHRDERDRLIVVAALAVAAIDLLDGEASV